MHSYIILNLSLCCDIYLFCLVLESACLLSRAFYLQVCFFYLYMFEFCCVNIHLVGIYFCAKFGQGPPDNVLVKKYQSIWSLLSFSIFVYQTFLCSSCSTLPLICIWLQIKMTQEIFWAAYIGHNANKAGKTLYSFLLY
jgi:hypothetical protein